MENYQQVDEPLDLHKLSFFYQENSKIILTFLEWRHKVMTNSFTVTGAVFAAVGWLLPEAAGAGSTAVDLRAVVYRYSLLANLPGSSIGVMQQYCGKHFVSGDNSRRM